MEVRLQRKHIGDIVFKNHFRSADSLSLLNRWLKEYNQLLGENPRAKCATYVNRLQQVIRESPPTKLEGETLISAAEKKVDATMTKLEKLRDEMLNIRGVWTEWEQETWHLEEVVRLDLENGTENLRGKY